MNKIKHLIEPEELMAYLDGELAAEREVVTTAHIRQCTECQTLIAELQTTSQSLKEWEAQPTEDELQVDPRQGQGKSSQQG